ncbi:MAG: Lrp/AsnC family transcriptional regulator [Paludibacteraceae bacterium]|nr:Lrp/AsnC family transcriptional regulator [Paludibacteraceae bacterium]
MEKSLDEIDKKLLRILQDDSSLSTKELAARVHLSPTPIYERVKHLHKNGFIKKYVAILNKDTFNYISVFCNIRLKKHSKDCMLDFVESIRNIEEVTECYNISGDFDYMLKIVARDMDHYQEFVRERLGVIDSIGSLHSLFVLKEEKNSYAIPL